MKRILIIFVLFLLCYPLLIMADLNKKELRVTLQPTVVSLDPGGIQDSQSWVVSRQVNCQLVRNQGSNFVLEAAESIKYITPLKIILKVSDKAKFHDGTLVTANDVLASFNYIKESRNILGNLFVWIDKIEVLDNKTILFSLKKHIPQFLKVLSSTNYTIYKKEFLEKALKDKTLWQKPLGCGGYKVVEFNNQSIKLMPISKGLPITFYVIKAGQIDASDLERYDIVTVNIIGKSKETDKFNVLETFDPVQFFVGLNSKSLLWKNRYERCKFLSEIDVGDLLKSYGKGAIQAMDLLPKGTLGYSLNGNFNNQILEMSKKPQRHISKSKKNSLCVAYLAVSIQERHKSEYLDMFKKIYPNVFMSPIENVKEFGKYFSHSKCDALLFAWKSNYLDGYEYLTMFENNDANFSGIYSKKLSNRISKSQDLSTAEGRAKEYQEIITEIGGSCIVRPLFTMLSKTIYVRKNLKTPDIGLISIHQYYLGNISR